MVSFPGSIAFDEFGKPFIILRDQDQQKRLTGNDAIKVSGKYQSVRCIFGMNHMYSQEKNTKINHHLISIKFDKND